ncbi:SIR2 family protein [Polaromonas sp. P1-6]|nr:SIR2 family protein [Polaromonas sp. P1-6]
MELGQPQETAELKSAFIKARSTLAKLPAPFAPDIRTFIDTFAEDIADGTAAIFAGAGLSVASGYVDWRGLMREIANELGLNVDHETNLVAVAQYHFNERRNRTRINQKIIDEFSSGHTLNDNHKILARLPIATYWTTNYDKMIETALEASGKVVDVKHTVEHLKTTQRGRNATVYKMHGDVGHPDQAVLTKDDYEGYFRDREPFVTALTGDLVMKTILFVGFSFSDPNIDYVMSRIRVVLRRQPKQHYCILRREPRRSREKIADYEYRQRQHDYFVKDLARMGIHALMVDEYADITRILQAVEARYRSPNRLHFWKRSRVCSLATRRRWALYRIAKRAFSHTRI